MLGEPWNFFGEGEILVVLALAKIPRRRKSSWVQMIFCAGPCGAFGQREVTLLFRLVPGFAEQAVWRSPNLMIWEERRFTAQPQGLCCSLRRAVSSRTTGLELRIVGQRLGRFLAEEFAADEFAERLVGGTIARAVDIIFQFVTSGRWRWNNGGWHRARDNDAECRSACRRCARPARENPEWAGSECGCAIPRPWRP